MTVEIPEGFGVYGPRGKETARKVLDATEEAGRDPREVKVHPSGFVVHKSVIEALGGKVEPDGTEENGDETADGLTDTEKEADKQAAESRDGEDESKAPAKSASKEDWVTFAKTQGYDESEDLTKDKLIERFGAQGE